MASTWSHEYYDEAISRQWEESQQKLLDSIDSVRSKRVAPLDTAGILQSLSHDGGIDEPIKPPDQDGLHLNDELYFGLKECGEFPKRLAFTVYPLQSIGREDSRNKVQFGSLALHNFSAKPDRVINVAIKPYVGSDGPRRALHEYAMNEYLTARGVGCPTQLGLIKNGSDLFAITEFAPHIITLDSLDWENLPTQVQTNAISRGLESLAALHKHGVFHGDAEFRNLPIQPERQEEWAVDFEYAASLAKTPDKLFEPAGILARLRIDLQCVCKSLVDYGMINPESSSSEKFQAQYDLVLGPYRAIMHHQTQPTPFIHKIRSVLDILDDLFYAEALGDNATELLKTIGTTGLR